MNKLKKQLEREQIKREIIYEQILMLREQLQSQDEIVRVLKEKVDKKEKEKVKQIRQQNERNNEAREIRRVRMQQAAENRLNYVGTCQNDLY